MRGRGAAIAAAIMAIGCGGSTSGSTAADGGAGTGGGAGAGGSSGAGASSGAGGAPTGPGCTSDADCTLVDDCCDCVAIGEGEAAPPCGGGECFATRCSSLGVGPVTAKCAAGRCVLGVSCDKTQATCKMLPSPCPAGQLHAVYNSCWGGCVPAGECGDVSGCADCDGTTQLCVANDDPGGTSYHCASLAPDCGSDRTCACAGKTVCVGGDSACNDNVNDGALHCGCPAC